MVISPNPYCKCSNTNLGFNITTIYAFQTTLATSPDTMALYVKKTRISIQNTKLL